MMADLAARVNQERISRGLTPYALNAQLTAAAQAHANDMALSGKLSHTGSDGSDVFARVARTGYGKYSWGYRLGENWAWYHDVGTAMQMWMNSAPHRENILHALYRELGIGIASAPMGGYIFVLVFGAQPNVLPIFINNGSGTASAPNVTLLLGDEQVVASGDGASTIGHPIEMQISNDPSFKNAKWQPYAGKVPWTLTSGSGTQTVYVKYRDAHSRTATASDSIIVGTAEMSKASNPMPTRTATRKPTATRTRTPKPTATLTLTPSSTLTALPTATDTPIESDTLTAEGTAAPNETPMTIAQPVATPQLAETETPVVEVAYHIALPSPQPTVATPAPTSLALAVQATSDISYLSVGIAVVALTLGSLACIKFVKTRL